MVRPDVPVLGVNEFTDDIDSSGTDIGVSSPKTASSWRTNQDPRTGDYVARPSGADGAEVNFRLDGEASDFENAVAGQGLRLTTPDNTAQYRLRVDKDGNLVTEEVPYDPEAGGLALENRSLTIDGPQVVLRPLPGGDAEPVDIPVEVVRDEGANRTVYEVAYPWEEFEVDAGNDVISLALTIIDYDGDTETGLLEQSGGIFGGKDNSEFVRADLVGN